MARAREHKKLNFLRRAINKGVRNSTTERWIKPEILRGITVVEFKYYSYQCM